MAGLFRGGGPAGGGALAFLWALLVYTGSTRVGSRRGQIFALDKHSSDGRKASLCALLADETLNKNKSAFHVCMFFVLSFLAL